MKDKFAFVFPGQGSQSIGMMSNFAGLCPEVRDTFTEASEILGYDVWELTENGPEEKLNQTQYTQPSLLVAGVAMWRVWQQSQDLLPDYLAGHSLGEYTALVCAGALSFQEGLLLVAKRGELMQQAVVSGKGAMAAILGLSYEQVVEACLEASQGDIVQPANLNAPGQIVISGDTVAVERALGSAKKLGAKKAVILPVSVPSHCELMRPAAEALKLYLGKIQWQAPKIPVLQNFDVAIHSSVDMICSSLMQQLFSPVRWIETIEYLVQHDVKQIVECGPGRVLTGLNKRIVKDVELSLVYDLVDERNVKWGT